MSNKKHSEDIDECSYDDDFRNKPLLPNNLFSLN